MSSKLLYRKFLIFCSKFVAVHQLQADPTNFETSWIFFPNILSNERQSRPNSRLCKALWGILEVHFKSKSVFPLLLILDNINQFPRVAKGVKFHHNSTLINQNSISKKSHKPKKPVQTHSKNDKFQSKEEKTKTVKNQSKRKEKSRKNSLNTSTNPINLQID